MDGRRKGHSLAACLLVGPVGRSRSAARRRIDRVLPRIAAPYCLLRWSCCGGWRHVRLSSNRRDWTCDASGARHASLDHHGTVIAAVSAWSANHAMLLAAVRGGCVGSLACSVRKRASEADTRRLTTSRLQRVARARRHRSSRGTTTTTTAAWRERSSERASVRSNCTQQTQMRDHHHHHQAMPSSDECELASLLEAEALSPADQRRTPLCERRRSRVH